MESNDHHQHRLGARISRESVALLRRGTYNGTKQNAFSEPLHSSGWKKGERNHCKACWWWSLSWAHFSRHLGLDSTCLLLMISRDSLQANELHVFVGSSPTEFRTNDARKSFAFFSSWTQINAKLADNASAWRMQCRMCCCHAIIGFAPQK